MIQPLKKCPLILLLLLVSLTAYSGGVHVHGQAYLSVALDGQNLVVGLTSAAHDVVGFEHFSDDVEERIRIEKAIETLKSSEKWLSFDAGDCVKQSAEVISPFSMVHTDHSDHSDHSKAEHNESGHADFVVTAEYVCKTPTELTGISVKVGELFNEIHHIEVQWLVHDRQGLVNLSASDHQVRFK